MNIFSTIVAIVIGTALTVTAVALLAGTLYLMWKDLKDFELR